MASWQDVQDHFRRNWRLDADMDDEFALTVSFGEDKKRLQRVMVHRYSAWGEPLVEIRSAFGELGELDPATLLSDSLQLPIGAIALHGRFLVVVAKLGLEHISVEGVEFLVIKVGMMADVLEERAGGEDRF